MNSGTLIGSLFFAAVLAVLIALMIRGWRRRARLQSELIGALPDLPTAVGPASVITCGMYVGCTWRRRPTTGLWSATSGTAAGRN